MLNPCQTLFCLLHMPWTQIILKWTYILKLIKSHNVRRSVETEPRCRRELALMCSSFVADANTHVHRERAHNTSTLFWNRLAVHWIQLTWNYIIKFNNHSNKNILGKKVCLFPMWLLKPVHVNVIERIYLKVQVRFQIKLWRPQDIYIIKLASIPVWLAFFIIAIPNM